MKYAYVTLLSSTDYVDGIAVLALSLQKVQSKYPLVVAITEEIASEETISLLKKLNCKIEIVQSLEYSETTKEKWKDKPVLNTASKLQIFCFKDWDKMVYIDGDSIILSNIDYLFNRLDGSVLYDEIEKMSLSTLFVFEPRNHSELRYYLTLLEHIDMFDGDIIDQLWFHVKTNSEYQISHLESLCEFDPSNNFNPLMKGIHFCNFPKPWVDINNERFPKNNFIIKMYRQYLDEIQQMK